MTEELYPVKPTVTINGKPKELELNPSLKGKSLEVYQYFIQNPGDHGIREIQSDLNYSSPSIAQYHVKRLLDHGVLIQTEDKRYHLKKDWLNMGNLEDHFRFLSFWIPRSLIYALILGSFSLVSVYMVLLKINSYQIWGMIAIPTSLFLTILLLFDSYKLSLKLSR